MLELLGVGIHQEVKSELKEEARRPDRFRVRVLTVLAGLFGAAFLAAMWVLWPHRREENSPAGAKPDRLGEARAALEGKGDRKDSEKASDGSAELRLDSATERRLAQEAATRRAVHALDAARGQRAGFDAEVARLLADDRGRSLAGDPATVARFRAIVEDPLLAGAARGLDELGPVPGVEPTALERAKRRADETATVYAQAKLTLEALVRHAGGLPRADVTLADAVQRLKEREALEALELKTRRATEARAAAAKAAADDEAKRVAQDEEEKRWGAVRPGAVWKGTITIGGVTAPAEFQLSSRKGDSFEGTVQWDFLGRKDMGLVAGTVDGRLLSWQVTRTLKGLAQREMRFSGRMAGTKLTGTYRENERSKEGDFALTLEPAK